MKTLETTEQRQVVAYLEEKGWIFSATLGGAYFGKNFSQIRKLYADGWRRGVPDLLIFLERKAGDTVFVFLEMKRDKKSHPTDEQKMWLEEAEKVDGCTGIVGYGAEDAIKKLEEIFCS